MSSLTDRPVALGEGLLSGLKAAVGDEHVLVDPYVLSSYVHDWTGGSSGRASCVVRPADAAQVAAVVRVSAAAGTPGVIFA